MNKKIKIGNLEISNNIFLAPMAGVTDLPFRKMCKEYGCGFVYSEMVSAKGLFYKDKKTGALMKLDDAEKPAAIQIFGSDANIISKVIPDVMRAQPALIDINMGCPTPKIVNNGDGSALLKNPELIGEIIYEAKKVSPVPVTVKIRKGWDEQSVNAVTVAKIAEKNGADAITVHPRTREQFYSGVADWDIIKEVVNNVNIPVIGNGDIFKACDAIKMMEYTGCSAVMIGRGAQGNPFIFKQINELLNGEKTVYTPDNNEKIDCAKKLLSELVLLKGENRGTKEARKHIAWFIKGMKQSSILKDRVFKTADYKDVLSLLDEYKNYINS